MVDKINVFLETRASRKFVGSLSKDSGKFTFEYSSEYAYSKSAIPLGPDLPLNKRVHESRSLFNSFKDRVPSKENPAYGEYCQKFGLSANEDDELLLLGTIGQRGPSSFIFEFPNNYQYSNTNYAIFRKDLGISIRDFALLFDIPLGTLQSIERNHSLGREALKRIEIYDLFPQIAKFEAVRNKALIHSDKFIKVMNYLDNKIDYNLRRNAES